MLEVLWICAEVCWYGDVVLAQAVADFAGARLSLAVADDALGWSRVLSLSVSTSSWPCCILAHSHELRLTHDVAGAVPQCEFQFCARCPMIFLALCHRHGEEFDELWHTGLHPALRIPAS